MHAVSTFCSRREPYHVLPSKTLWKHVKASDKARSIRQALHPGLHGRRGTQTPRLYRQKRGTPENFVLNHLSNFLSLFTVIQGEKVEPFLQESLAFVRDPTDAPYVALALHLSQTYPSVILLTYNLKDYKRKLLKARNIHVFHPNQLTSPY